ncbi:MAG TPA: hypothetical protein VFH80_21675 [Solirubrobacteraceae bacterium]|nr:hypothetical protein [Solirubrobacteraceae bacterium]
MAEPRPQSQGPERPMILLADTGAARIITRGHGEADPVAPNTQNGHDNPAGRAQNRRVVISFARG